MGKGFTFLGQPQKFDGQLGRLGHLHLTQVFRLNPEEGLIHFSGGNLMGRSPVDGSTVVREAVSKTRHAGLLVLVQVFFVI